jgi:hypothetical protein
MVDEAKLRHPLERRYFVVAIVLNFVIVAGAIILVAVAPDWLKAYPVLRKQVEVLSGLAIAAVLGVPLLALQRRVRVAEMRGRSVRLSTTQFGGVHEILEAQCRMLGIAVPPELFITDKAIAQYSWAYSAGGIDYIVLHQNIVDPDFEKLRDVIAFAIGSELGRIRLGHTGAWQEMLVTYVVAIPLIGNPLRQVRTFSRDRYAATLAPDGFRGLMLSAIGRRLLDGVNVAEFLAQARDYEGRWVSATRFDDRTPPVLRRIQELERTGFASFLPKVGSGG